MALSYWDFRKSLLTMEGAELEVGALVVQVGADKAVNSESLLGVEVTVITDDLRKVIDTRTS